MDSIAMLTHTNAQLSQFRRDKIKPTLKSEYSSICEAEEQTDSQLLFGDEYEKCQRYGTTDAKDAKNMKDAKEANQIGYAIKSFNKTLS